MADKPSETSGDPPVPSGAYLRQGLAGAHHEQRRLRIRLIVAIPAMFALITMAYGYTIYSIFQHYVPDDPGNEEWGQAMFWSMAAMVGFFLLSVGAGAVLAQAILRPLRRISEAFESVAHGALETGPVQIDGVEEIEAVGHSFNSMIQYLNRVFQERNRYLLESGNPGSMEVNLDGRVTAVNRLGERVLRLSARELAGKRIEDLIEVYRDDPDIGLFFERVHQALSSEAREHGGDQIIAGEDGAPRLSISFSVDRAPDGQPRGYIFDFRDLSRAEAMRRLLARSDQLAAMGAFAMGLAHEVRNPLGSIKGMAQLLEEEAEHDPSKQNFLEQIVREVDRLDAFVRELLEYGQDSPTPPSWCDLSELAAEGLHLARSGSQDLHEKGVRFEEDFCSAPSLYLQRERVVRALANIVGNAIDAALQDGTVSVRTRIDGGMEGAQEDARLIVEVENRGPPISTDDMERIFEPFFTTKPGGTGLGLAIAYQVVVQNDGELRARCEDGLTCFTLEFPLPAPVAKNAM